MPIPSAVSDLSTTASSNYPSGSESANQLDDYHRALCSIVRQVSDAKEDSGVAAAAITAERTAVATLTNKTLTAPALGTPASGNLANCTFPTIPVASGGTGLTNPGASGNVLTSNGTAWTSSALPADGLQTSDFTGSNQSLASSGYQKLPGGLIVQWGVASVLSTPLTVNLPITFPTGGFTVTAGNTDTSGSYTCAASYLSASQISVMARVSSSGAAATTTVHWIAIGR